MSDETSTATPAAAPIADAAAPAADATALGGVTEAKTETTTTDAKVETKADAKAETKDAKTAPTLVDDKWEPKALEGVTRDAKALGEFRELAKKHGFNAEQAQALVEFSDAREKAQAEAAAAELTTADKQWVKEMAEDKEFGGAKQKASVEAARSLLRSTKHGPALSKWLDEVGIGNAAPLVRFIAELAGKVGEDSVKGTLAETAPQADPFERAIAVTYGKSNASRKES